MTEFVVVLNDVDVEFPTCRVHSLVRCSDPLCIGNVLLAEVRDAELWQV